MVDKSPRDDFIPFESARVLLESVQQVFPDYSQEEAEFLKLNEPSVIHKVDSRTRENVYYLKFPRGVPASIRHLATRIVNDLRHALDHAFCDAVIEAGRSDAKGVYFPLGESAADFERQIGRCCIRVHPALTAFCRTQEPYRHGKGELVWALSRLSARGKHQRLIHLVQQVYQIAYPIEGSIFTGPIHLNPVWTENAGEVEFARGRGEIHATLRVGTRLIINTASANLSIQGTQSLDKCLKIVQDIVAGLETEVARIKAEIGKQA